MSDEKQFAVIEDTAEEQSQEIGLTESEIATAKEHGLIKDEEPEKEEKVEEKKEEKEEEVKVLDPESFDEMEEAHSANEDKFHKSYTPNAKALYFKYKRQKQLRQEAQVLAEKAEKDRDYVNTQTKAYQKKLKDVNDILDRIDNGDENLTTADIRKIVALREAQAQAEDKKEETKKPEVQQERYLRQKSKDTYELGVSKHPDFNRYVDLCNEIVKQDKDIALIITSAFNDPEVDESELVNKIVRYARMHPDFEKKEVVQKDAKEKSDIDRIVENSKKKKTSAAITGGSGGRRVSYDELTLEDVAKMNRSEYDKLPKEVRERILKQAS